MLDSPSIAISGRQLCPPAAIVSRSSVAASRAEASGGALLSVASKNGSTSRSYSAPRAFDHFADASCGRAATISRARTK